MVSIYSYTNWILVSWNFDATHLPWIFPVCLLSLFVNSKLVMVNVPFWVSLEAHECLFWVENLKSLPLCQALVHCSFPLPLNPSPLLLIFALTASSSSVNLGWMLLKFDSVGLVELAWQILDFVNCICLSFSFVFSRWCWLSEIFG